LYKFMTATEQEELMADIARLEDAGRLEALRENRDHMHVFAFADGQRPQESLIAQSLKVVDAELPAPRVAPRPAKRAAVRGRRPSRVAPASLRSARRGAPAVKALAPSAMRRAAVARKPQPTSRTSPR